MAGDLIPPPSPAGRPGREHERTAAAERLPVPATAQADALVGAGPAAEDPPARPSRYRSRFGFVTGALIGIALAAIAVAAIVATRSNGSSPSMSWSAWKPAGTDRMLQVAEIAEHVGREYRLNDGSQLDDVEAGPLAINNVPLTPVVRTAAHGGDIVPIYGNGILYVLNGLGNHGSIATEKPSSKRLALVERESLELALYTFRYVKNVDHVVAMLPPAPTGSSGTSDSSAAPSLTGTGRPIPTMLFRPGDLKAQLQVPLALTFPSSPPRPATISTAEANLLQRATSGNIFNASVVPSQTGQGFLVLDRPAPANPVQSTLQSAIPKSK